MQQSFLEIKEVDDNSNNSWRRYAKLTAFFAVPNTTMGVVIGGIAKGFGHVVGHVVGGVVGLASAPILAGVTMWATKSKRSESSREPEPDAPAPGLSLEQPRSTSPHLTPSGT